MDTPQRGLSIKLPAKTKNAPEGVFSYYSAEINMGYSGCPP